MVTALNHLGLSCSTSTTRRAVDRLCAEHSAAIMTAKLNLEVYFLTSNAMVKVQIIDSITKIVYY